MDLSTVLVCLSALAIRLSKLMMPSTILMASPLAASETEMCCPGKTSRRSCRRRSSGRHASVFRPTMLVARTDTIREVNHPSTVTDDIDH
eukprot:3831099-Amphidinium_carterae.1